MKNRQVMLLPTSNFERFFNRLRGRTILLSHLFDPIKESLLESTFSIIQLKYIIRLKPRKRFQNEELSKFKNFNLKKG